MQVPFKNKLIVEYPIPMSISVWGSDDETIEPLASLEDLLNTCVDELASDILVTEFIDATSMNTNMPSDCVMVNSAKLNFSFQGNRLVKFTYDEANKVCSLRYFPATITYKRKFRYEDYDTITGDRLRMIKAYVLSKMAEKEIQMLSVIKLDSDNGTVDLDELQKFADKNKEIYENLKLEILIYDTAP